MSHPSASLPGPGGHAAIDRPSLATASSGTIDPARAADLRLAVSGLTKTYGGGIRALDGVDLDIPCGMFGLLGPNGAGKSTLMRILATLQDADAGTARLGGLDVLRDHVGVRRILGYLPQEFGLHPQVRAADLLTHFTELKGIADRRRRAALVEHLLVRTNLWEVRNQRVGGFSGGMRQRFGVAVALIGDPRLIIVDEPTAGLDPAERVRFLNLLAEIGEGSVVILSTHIVEDVAELCPRMAIINHGRIVFQGGPEVATAGLAGRVWCTVVPRGEVAAAIAGHRVISQRLQAGRVQVRVLADACPGDGFLPAEPAIDDVYFAAITPTAAG